MTNKVPDIGDFFQVATRDLDTKPGSKVGIEIRGHKANATRCSDGTIQLTFTSGGIRAHQTIAMTR